MVVFILVNIIPSNKQSEFVVLVDNPIDIDEDSWEVALVEIATPSEVINKTEDFFWLFLISIVCTQNLVWKIST